VRLTRRKLFGGAGAAALGAAGVYELVDRLGSGPPPRPAATPLPLEQHVLDGVPVVLQEGVRVVVPPLHHQVVTARVGVSTSPQDLKAAQSAFEEVLRQLERTYDPTPAGLGITVGWGLPYFRRYVPSVAATHLPVDRRASERKGKRVSALLDAIRFPSDPPETILERNEIVVLLRSDVLEHIEDAAKLLFDKLGAFEPTSIRKGFAGGGFSGGQSLPKKMAMAAGVPGAALIPDRSELFLGFTSTQKEGLGPRRIANIETLRYSDGGPGGYFRQGTAMHLSHITEDLEAWYINFDFSERAATAFRPGLPVKEGAMTVRQGPKQAATIAGNEADYRREGRIGHSAAIQTASRLQQDVLGADGTRYRKGTAIPQRADFNTLDNPFFWSAHPARDGMSDAPAAGVHFVVFTPTSDDFHRGRLAMDGVLPDGTRLEFTPRARGQGFNSILKTTHRQNFLVPPRRHRSFPLVELLD
jgi:hypothetical protein